MTHARYLIGDVFEQLATLETDSVDLVLTSPPFLALRSYLPADHPDKAKEIGSESTPAMFIDRLLDVVEALDRVVAPHGSICIELGDTYSGSGGAGGDYNENGLRDGQERFDGSALRNRYGKRYEADGIPRTGPGRTTAVREGWPLDKSLCLIPETFRFALVYGHNPHNGRQTPRWRARNVIRWVRPNPPVGALGDKFRPATSEMVVLCKSRSRYFDLDAVRTPYTELSLRNHGGVGTLKDGNLQGPKHEGRMERGVLTHEGAPPLDWWNIPTQPYAGSHYATFPEQLCVTPIKAMSPMKVCRQCGQPSRRIVEHERTFSKVGASAGRSEARTPKAGPMGADYEVFYTTLGWSDCGHNNWRTGLVLDPFAGSGTTLQVATGHGRDAIGIDLDPRNADLALDRVGPLMLTIEQDNDDAARLA